MAVLDERGRQCAVASFATPPEGRPRLGSPGQLELSVGRVGVESSAGLGPHTTQVVVAAGHHVGEVPANRTAEPSPPPVPAQERPEDAEGRPPQTTVADGPPRMLDPRGGRRWVAGSCTLFACRMQEGCSTTGKPSTGRKHITGRDEST